MQIIRSETTDGVIAAATDFLRELAAAMSFPAEKAAPCAANISGTYEEMYSNWRNKMAEAESRNDTFASYMNLAWFDGMLKGIAAVVDIPDCSVMGSFDPVHLDRNTALFDETLAAYEAVYRQAGMHPVRYSDMDAFLQAYAPAGEA